MTTQDYNVVISRLEAENRQLRKLSLTDELTRTYNRRYLTHYIESSFSKYGVVLLLDIDNFKDTNTAYGHSFGDRVLREIGGVLLRSVRSSDSVIRMGGDEFCIVLKNGTKKDGINCAKRIKRAINAIDIDGSGITVSIGIAEANSFDDAYKSADKFLYIAKNSGKNKHSNF